MQRTMHPPHGGSASPAILLTDFTGEHSISHYGTQRHGFMRSDEAASRHNEGCNYLFCDMHVKWLRPTQIPCSDQECWWSIAR
ncbi:MAG: H-X9-DG-CTERM domain-containing protein [Armatimonadota bacterium]|nr:H-X9-DG-CTERM domain-containing protein [Armatimonadota bacterium]